ncbi:MAG: methionyl-tRNA formyltransferase [Myxococcota bacterium]
MRVIFMGTPDFAVPTLDALVQAGHEVVLVVAQPDRPAGRGNKLRAPPVAERAEALGLPLAQPRAIKRGPFPERYASLEADVSVVIAYGRILTEHLLNAPRLGCINVHASLLPRWRGAAPIQHAILAGDTETGVCTQQMEPDLDTGPIFVERRTSISVEDTSATLHDRLSELAADAAVATLEALSSDPPAVPTPQPEEGITWAPKIEKADGRIDLSGSAIELDRRVRAMTPWPGGFLPYGEGALKLREVAVVDEQGSPGTVLSVDPLVVACGERALELRTVQAPGRTAVDGRSFANGARLRPGDRLGYDDGQPAASHEQG